MTAARGSGKTREKQPSKAVAERIRQVEAGLPQSLGLGASGRRDLSVRDEDLLSGFGADSPSESAKSR